MKLGLRVVMLWGLLVVAAGLWFFHGVHLGSSYLDLVWPLIVFATGTGFVSAPMTSAIMGAVSDEKQGVASAVNDTTREVGGALVIAIAGSILASGYTSRISPVERRQKLKAAGPPSGQPVPRLHQRAAALCGLTTALVRPGSHSVVDVALAHGYPQARITVAPRVHAHLCDRCAVRP